MSEYEWNDNDNDSDNKSDDTPLDNQISFFDDDDVNDGAVAETKKPEEEIPEDDDAEDGYSAFDKDFVKAWNTTASAGLDSQIEGLDSSGLSNSINNNEAFIEKEIDAGYGIAGKMREMEGNPISETDRIISQFPNNKDITG